MTKEEFIALGVAEDVAVKLAEASTKELAGFVSKTDFDLLTAQKNNLDLQAKDHAKQLEDLKKAAGDSDALKKQIADLQEANKKAKADYEARISSIRLNNELDKALSNAKAKNAKAVKALLDMESIEWDEEKGKLTGLSRQLQKLQENEDSKFLFDVSNPEGGKPNSGIHGDGGRDNEGGGGKPSGDNGGGGKSLGEQMAAMFNAEHAAPADNK